MKKLFLVFALLLNGCATIDIREFEHLMTEEEKYIFLVPVLIYDINACYINLPANF